MNQTEAEKRADERKKRLLKYFTEVPDPRNRTAAIVLLAAGLVLAAAAGAILLLLENHTGAEASAAAAIMALAAGVDKFVRYRKQYHKSHPRPSDLEMDQLLGDEIIRSQSTALEKLEITADDLELSGGEWDPLAELEMRAPRRDVGTRRPLVVFGPDSDTRAEIGADGLWRCSDYRVMVICPTHFSLGIYLCTIDLLTGAIRSESTHEYHYDDVVAISTTTVGEQENPRALRDGKVHFARTIHHELRIVASSGDSPAIPVVLPSHGRSNPAGAETSDIENVIASVRRVLRDRKNAAHLQRI
jgi:hypothetical protein